VLHGLSAPLRPASAAPAAANKIVRFLRTSGLPAPAASQLAPLAAGLAEVGRRLVGSVPVAGAIGALLSLGGDSAQRAAPATDLLPRLTRSRATLDQTFEALNDLVTATTGWPDLSGRRAALQSLLARSRSQIRGLAVGQPQQAARQLAALFALFELRAGDAGGADQGRLAAARAILARSRPAQAAATATQSAPPPASGPRPARALKGATPKGAAPKGTVPAVAPARVPALGSPPAPAIRPRGLVPPRADVTHTGRVGTAEEIATRQRQATARALREAAAIYYDRRKTLLAGGDEAAMAEAVYKDTPLQALGVSLAQFQARLQAGQEPASAAGARVRAGPSGNSGGLVRGRGADPSPLEKQIIFGLNTLVNNMILTSLSPETQAGGSTLGEMLANRNWTLTHRAMMDLPTSTGNRMSMPVTIRLRRTDGGVHVNAQLDPNLESANALRPLGKPVGAFSVDYTLHLKKSGRIMLPPGTSPMPDLTLKNPWGAGGLPNASGHFGLPQNFFDPGLSAETFSRQVARAPGLDASWVPSPAQQKQLLNLFVHRDALAALLHERYASHDEALGKLADALRSMEREPRTRPMFPVELLFHVFPAGLHPDDGTLTWGIGFGAVGLDNEVRLFPARLGAGLGKRPPAPGITNAHVHPTHRQPTQSGFSLEDVAALQQTGTPLAVYDNGVAMRMSLGDAWFTWSAQTRREHMENIIWLSDKFQALQARTQGPKAAQPDPARPQSAITSIDLGPEQLTQLAQRMLGALPLVFEVIGEVPRPEQTVAVGSYGWPLLAVSKARIR
jgi:hypothetical protein